MKTRSAVLALAFLIPAAAAQAQPQAPQVHVQVLPAAPSPNGDNVVVIAVTDVRAPIVDNRPLTPDGGNANIDAMVLSRAKKALVHLDDTGDVIWQTSRPLPRLPQYGSVYGFVVLEGAALPLSREAS